LPARPPPSSSGPGRRVLSPKTGVRLPVGVLTFSPCSAIVSATSGPRRELKRAVRGPFWHLKRQNKGNISVAAATSAPRSSGRTSKARSLRYCPQPGCKEVHPVWRNEAKNGWYLTVRDPSRPRRQRQDRLAKGWQAQREAIRSWHESQANRASGASILLLPHEFIKLGAEQVSVLRRSFGCRRSHRFFSGPTLNRDVQMT